MDKSAKKLAAKGRHGDTKLAHLTPGEVVVPKSVQPATLGLLADAFAQSGHDLGRYTVGDNASKNPRTGLLEFYDDDNGNDNGDDNDKGAGKAAASGMGGDGERGWGGRDRGDGSDADTVARAMMSQNEAPLGYGRFTGETAPGTLSRMRENMREAGYAGSGISDTMRDMGVGYGTRAGLLGYGTALGSLGTKALNALGGTLGGMALGPFGSILGGTLGSAVTADNMDQWGSQFGRNVLGGLIGGAAGAVAGPQYGGVASLAANKLANVASNRAFSSQGPAQRNARDPGANNDRSGIAGLMREPANQPAAVAASNYNYTPGPVTSMAWDPVQWGALYDPVRGLLG